MFWEIYSVWIEKRGKINVKKGKILPRRQARWLVRWWIVHPNFDIWIYSHFHIRGRVLEKESPWIIEKADKKEREKNRCSKQIIEPKSGFRLDLVRRNRHTHEKLENTRLLFRTKRFSYLLSIFGFFLIDITLPSSGQPISSLGRRYTLTGWFSLLFFSFHSISTPHVHMSKLIRKILGKEKMTKPTSQQISNVSNIQ